jgi:hypothetical protein
MPPTLISPATPSEARNFFRSLLFIRVLHEGKWCH